MSRNVLFLAIVLAVTVQVPLRAQDYEVFKWGDVSSDALHMSNVTPDSNAAAIILFDRGETDFLPNGKMRFKRHRRVKVLTEGGYDLATVDVPYYAEDDVQEVRRVNGQTFTLGAESDPDRHEMDGDALFDEDVDGEYRRVRFTLPALEPGAVFEYSYEIVSENFLFLPAWEFQSSEPTLWSEYEADIPDALHYVTSAHMVTEYAVEESKSSARGTRHRWAMKDVPALRKEPFITTLDDYRARLAFQLSGYENARGHGERVLSTWEKVAEDLMDHEHFGDELGRHGEVADKARALTEDLDDPVAKVTALYDYVRSSIAWNGEQGYLLDRDLDDVLEAKRGTSPEVNLLLVDLLREAGLAAHPVLISTRSHGQPQPAYPMLRQFNDLIAYVKAGDEERLLDATDPLRPATLLPADVLNGQGWLVDEKRPQWIAIPPGGADRRSTYVQATLAPDGTLSGSITATNEEYSALDERAKLKEEDEKDYVRAALLGSLGSAVLESHDVTGQQGASEPLRTVAAFSAPAYAQAAGDFLYVNPVIADRRAENPLKTKERTFPVDFPYPRVHTYTLSLELPDGYEVQEQPQNIQVQLPGEAGAFSRLAQVAGNRLTLRMRFVLAHTRFEPHQYQGLRDFYGRVVAAHAEQIVLRRRADEPAEALATPEAPATDSTETDASAAAASEEAGAEAGGIQ